MAGLRFTIAGEWCTMVPFHFKSMHAFQKVLQHCFAITDGCCTSHRGCCTLWISIIRTAITSDSFRVMGAITCQNEGLDEFYGFDSFQPSTDRLMPKKDNPNLNRVSLVFYPSFFRHVDFYGKTGLPWLVFDLPSMESSAPWYRSVSNLCTHFKKSYDTVSPFRTDVAPCTVDVAPCTVDVAPCRYRLFGRP